MNVRPKLPSDGAWVRSTLVERWGSVFAASVSGLHDATLLDGLVAELDGAPVGLLIYRIVGDDCEAVTVDSLVPGQGIGTALLNAAAEVARANACRRLWLVTTNDNLSALRFYQRRGMSLVALHRDAVTEHRRTVKPQIPELGHDGIPIQHALELELLL
jgi:ribosomal protein S18 acetylase RimI-like enzyme